jgi:DNA-binding NarL/FixJ family response regulator
MARAAQVILFAATRLVREALTRVLIDRFNAGIAGSFAAPEAAVARARAGNIDLLIADLSESEGNLVPASIDSLGGLVQDTRLILIIDVKSRTWMSGPALRRADACIARDEGTDTLAIAVASVLGGRSYRSPGVERLLALQPTFVQEQLGLTA